MPNRRIIQATGALSGFMAFYTICGHSDVRGHHESPGPTDFELPAYTHSTPVSTYSMPLSLRRSSRRARHTRPYRQFMAIVWTAAATGAAFPVVRPLNAQQPSAAQTALFQGELAKRGLTEAEARVALEKEGLSIDRLNPMEIPTLIPRVRAILDKAAAAKVGAAQAAASRAGQASPAAPANASISPAKESDSTSTVAETRTDSARRVMVQMAPDSGVYGHAIFADQTLNVFRTTDGARAPDSYILGAGDRIRVMIFGISQEDLLFEINSEGYIKPTGVPKIFLRGVTLGQARRLLQERLTPYFNFRADQFSLTIETARTMTVSVFGEAKVRGSFTISALNTPFNALMAAGGPTAIGSVRDIQVIRGTNRRRLDVYAFLADPSVMADFDLQQNDVIFIPAARRIVTFEGAVKRPMKYELVEGEDLRTAIGFAGGVQFDAYPDFVQVQRVEGDSVVLKEWKLSDVLRGTTRVPLADGDVVRIRSIGRPLERYAEVEGAVVYGGRYDLTRNPTLQAVLEQAKLRPQAKKDLLFIERRLPDETVRILPVAYEDSTRSKRSVRLEPRDRIVVFDRERYTSVAAIEVAGAVRNPFSRSVGYGETLPLKYALGFAGGAIPSAAPLAFVYRTDLKNPERVTHLRVDTGRDSLFALQAGDRLVVYDQQTYSEFGELTIAGAVRNSMRTVFDPALTLSDLITMAGGTTLAAASNRVDVLRLRITADGATFDRIPIEVDSSYRVVMPAGGFTLAPFDQVVVREVPYFATSRTVQISGAARYPGVYPLANSRVHLTEVIEHAGGLLDVADDAFATIVRSEGRVGTIGIDLRRALRNRKAVNADPILLAGDIITISRRQNTISIRLTATRMGELVASGATALDSTTSQLTQTFAFEGEKSARWYIQNYAGGFSKKADRWSVVVTDPSGRVRGTRRRLLFFRNYPDAVPGATVSLQFKPEPLPGQKNKVDLEAVYNRTIQTVTMLLSLVVLGRQLQ
jgi:protein involved in polysaccharide export with SLBB domain